MAITMFSTSALAVLAGVACVVYLCYRQLTFKPIPGIPHNTNSAYTVLGDFPRMLAQLRTGETLFPWLMDETVRQNSPVVQVFTHIFRKPWVIVADYRESQDILLRRTKEFDRSTFQGDMFKGITPDFHVHFSSDHQDLKKHKNLLKDLMTPAFLNQVAAPQVHAALENLVQLWSMKAMRAEERPFEIGEDTFDAVLDAITAVAFGLDIEKGAVMEQIRRLQESAKPSIPSDTNTPVEFEHANRPEAYQGLVDLVGSIETIVKSPFPRLTHWCIRKLPWYRRANQAKEALITGEIEKGVARIKNGDKSEKCALDNVLQREHAAATKENRKPEFMSRMIIDELFGFLIGGHDTTSTTILWGMKFLSTRPAVQATLRAHLLQAYPLAVAGQRSPTVDEITKTNIPYLDAAIEETNRTAQLFPAVPRTAKTDTVILGHAVPAGTVVMLATTGPDYFSRPFAVPEARRSPSARAAKFQVGAWDPADMTDFQPARWLKPDDHDDDNDNGSGHGGEVYDSMAGPHLAFGLGPRACYGRRLAYLQLRVMLVMIVWNFELLEVPGELGSFRGVEKMARVPVSNYLKLRKIVW